MKAASNSNETPEELRDSALSEHKRWNEIVTCRKTARQRREAAFPRTWAPQTAAIDETKAAVRGPYGGTEYSAGQQSFVRKEEKQVCNIRNEHVRLGDVAHLPKDRRYDGITSLFSTTTRQ